MTNIANASEYSIALDAAFAERLAYETNKSADNTSMQATLSNMRKSANHTKIAEIMLASNVDANFINRSERVSNRFNVYSAEKVINVARYLASASALNHYTLAIVKTAFALEEKELVLTQDDAQSACSLSVKCKDAKREKIVVKYQKHVAKNTASTQASSSINALQMYNILKEERDASNTVCFRLNRDCVNTIELLYSLNLIALEVETIASE